MRPGGNRGRWASGNRWLIRSRMVTLLSAIAGFLAFFATIGIERLDSRSKRNQIETLSLQAYDLAYRFRPVVGNDIIRDPDVVLVQINDETYKQLGNGRPPLPRSVHARLLRQLKRFGARVVAFDIVFAGNPNPGETTDMAGAMRELGKVVVAGIVEKEVRGLASGQDSNTIEHCLFSDGELRDAGTLGWAQVAKDVDDTVRRFEWFTLALNDDAERVAQPALSPAACALYLGINPLKIPQDVQRHRFGGRPIAVLPRDLDMEQSGARYVAASDAPVSGPTSYIDFVGAAGQGFRTFAYEDIIRAPELERQGRHDFAELRDRLVLVGEVSGLSQDIHKTPIRSPITRNYQMPGMQVQANAMHTILSGQYIRAASERTGLLALLVACLVTTLTVRGLRTLAGLLAAPGGIVLMSLLSGFLFLRYRFWLDPVVPGIGIAVAYAFEMVLLQSTERRMQRELRHVFGRVVGRPQMEDLMREDRPPQLTGELREITLLFSDLQGFTGISEHLHATELVQLLNDYFDVMLRIIQKHGGAVDKLMGDGIMAFFGAPQPQADHARRAVACALEMQQALTEFRQAEQRRHLPPFYMRIGVHTGEAVVGLVGAQDRSDYSVIGDVVNIASRLEGLNKEFGTTVMMSDTTYREARPLDGAVFRGEVQVKGRAQPVPVFSTGPLMQPDAGEDDGAEGLAAELERGEAAPRIETH